MVVHGDSYSDSLIVHPRRIESLKACAVGYRSIILNRRQLCDLELLLNRAFYPLIGYLGKGDYQSVLERMRLEDGTLWPMPICLDVNESVGSSIEKGQHLALTDEEGFLLAVLTVEEVWRPDKRKEAQLLYGTDDADEHPGVRLLFDEVGSIYISGSLEGVHLPIYFDFSELRPSPTETSSLFVKRGWRHVIGFHTEKHLHCAHKEMTQLAAREANANIFLHPVVGPTHRGDLDHYTQVRCYQEVAKKYPKNMILLGLVPLAMRRTGPREALWQAMIRKNYGCSHFMVASDQGDPFIHSSSGDRYYPRHAAQDLVQEHEEETGIAMIRLKEMVYAEDRAQYIPKEDVQSGMRTKSISSAELRRRLEGGLEIPAWFTYPEITNELRFAHPPRSKQGFTLFFTGLSGSGKSTLARVLMVKFLEMRTRPVTLLDGDIVRSNLSSELTFSKEHRDLNITRIGFVANEITKNGGIAICAPIAPYEEPRRRNREMISQSGGYIEIYVSTPIEVCERRDRKGLYAKARAGEIKGVTGIDDPYIPPSNPELSIDTAEVTPEEAVQQILLFLAERGYVS